MPVRDLGRALTAARAGAGRLFTNLVDRAFEGFLLPLLGLVFLPFATLFYVLAYRPVVGVSGWGWFFVFLGLLFDLGSYGGGARSRRR
jgi:hypothetical protein